MIEEKNKIVHPPSGMFRMLARSSKGMLVLSLACGVVGGVSSMVLIYLITNMLYENATTSDYRILYFAGVLLILLISGLASNILLVRLGQNSMFEMRMLLSRQILATPFRKLEEIGSSRIYSMLTGDIQSLVGATQSLPIFAISVATLAGGFVYLAWLSTVIFLITIFFVITGVAI